MLRPAVLLCTALLASPNAVLAAESGDGPSPAGAPPEKVSSTTSVMKPQPDAPAGVDAMPGDEPDGRVGGTLGGIDSERYQLESTSIRGNRELPRVLYILPWQTPELAELTGRPAGSLIEEVLSPLDRRVFRRELNYHEQLQERQRALRSSDAAAIEATAQD